MTTPKKADKLPEFDSSLSPNNEYNKDVAAKRGLRYDPQSQYYKDVDGCLIRDKFGQPL